MSTPENQLTRQMTLPEFADLVGDKLGIPKVLRDSIFERETGFQHYDHAGQVKRSPKGALGIGQLMPATAARFGVNPHDPLENIYGALKYQKFLYDRYLTDTGDEKQAMLLTAAAYNSGEGNVEKFKGVPPFAETQNYVRYVASRIRGSQPQIATKEAVDWQNPESVRAEESSVFAPPTLTTNDATWHFGMTPDEAKKLTPKALRVLTEAVQEDQRKKDRGQEIPEPSVYYQNEMRKSAGLPLIPLARKPIFSGVPEPPDYFGGNKLMPIDRADAHRQAEARQLAEAKEDESTAGGLRGLARMAGLPSQLLPDAAQDWIDSALAKGTSGLLKFLGGTVRAVPSDPFERNQALIQAANKLNTAANEIGGTALQVDRRARRGFLSQTANDVLGGTISSSPAMGLVALGVPAPVAFGLQSYLEANADPDASLGELLKQAGKGATIGALFELPVPVKLNMLGRIGYRMGTVGAGTGAIELATGSDTKNAATNALVNSIFAASGAMKHGGVPEKSATQIDAVPDIPDIPVSTISEPRVIKRTPTPPAEVIAPLSATSDLPSVSPQREAATTVTPETATTASTPPLKPLTTLAVGIESPVSTERGTEIVAKYAIVEAPELVTSHDSMLNKNPNFPEELQPRERERAASADQIDRISKNPRGERLEASPMADTGAPIVGPDGLVESGNARVLGLRKAFAAGKAGEYRQYLLDNAEALGLDRAAIEGATEPILVRIRQTEVDRPQFVREANESGVASMSAPEQARSDAGRLSGSLLSIFAPSESGEINTAANTPFIQGFLRDVVGPNELGRYVNAKGEVSQEGLARIRNAIFARAYGDSPEGLRALEKIAESPDNNVRNITTALLQRAGQFAALKEGIAKGDRHPLDPTGDFTKALAKMSSLREQNTTVADYLNQGALFGSDLTPMQKQMLWAFDEFKRSTKNISSILDNYAKGAEAAGSPKQTAFFEKSPPTKEALLEAAIRETVRDGNKEISLLEAKGVPAEPETSRGVPNIDQASKPASEGVPQPDRSIEVGSAAEADQGSGIESQNLGPGAANINEPFPEVKERSFGKQLMADERLVDDLKESLGTSRYYEPIPNNLTAANAAEFVDSRGIPEAMKAIRDESNGMPFHIRAAAGQVVILRLNEAIRSLKDVSPEKARFALDQATEMSEWSMNYGTRLGQGAQIFALWKRLLPEGKLLTFKRAVEKAQKEFAGKKSAPFQNETNGEQVKQIVSELNQPTITITNAETAEAAPIIRDAIERAMKESGPQSGVPASPEKEMTIWGQYKDSIAKQLANMAIPKKASPRPALQEFSERLLNNVEGLIQRPAASKAKPDIYGEMREVIENWDKYQDAWNEAITFIRDKYTKKLKIDEQPLLARESLAELNAMERRITDLNSAFQTRAFDKVFNDAVKQAELNFRGIAKSHYLDKQATRDALIESIQKDIGIKLSPEEAEAMVSRIEQKLEAHILRGREQILKGLEQSGNKIAKKVTSITDKLIEAARVGILTEQKFYELAAEKLGLPKYDKATAEHIYELAGKVEDAPEGVPKDRAIFELNKFIAQQKGFGPEDLPYGIYYGNILSGYNTHIVNTVDTALNVISEVNGLVMNNPRAAAKIYAGLLRGLNEGKLDALMALTEGRMVTDGKWLEVPRLMEIAEFGKRGGVPIRTDTAIARATKAIAESKIAYPLNAYKYVTRMLAASDSVFFRSAKEARASLLAYRIAEAEGLKGDALETRVREILALDRQSDFLAQAHQQGLTGTEAQTQALQLREFVRDKDLNSDSADFAGEATYNHDPHGLLGMFSSGLSRWSDTFKPLKLFVPFTRIVANVTNRGLNYTPWGYKRAAFGYTLGEGLSPEARRLMITRATIGTAGLVTLGAMQHAGLLQVHGNGPSDADRRRQLMSAGWKPYSIQMGSTYISYLNSPLGLGLSVVGNMTDSQRYHELEQKDAGTRGAYAIARIGSTVFSQSFLAGLSRLFEALSSQPSESVNAVKQIMSGTVAATTTPNLVRDVYRLFDNKQYQSDTFTEDLVRNTPFAALMLRPSLNAFGEPVTLPRQRFVDIQSSDPAWRFVMARGLRVPVPGRTTELKPGKRLTAEQYYSLLQTTGPELKRWITDNQLRLSAMTEAAAQKELSKAAETFHERALDQMEPSRLIMRSVFRGVPRPPEMASPTPNP